MTINIEQLRKRLSPRYPDVEQIEQSVVRFTRRADDRPFAVYYVDVSPPLPSTSAALDEYQDRVVGKHFFEGNKSLQWSNYLFLLVEAGLPWTTALQKARELIERDRKYARKFVITEDELDSAISPPSVRPTSRPAIPSILNTWTSLLAAANLDRAILNDESLPRRIELIEAGFGQNATTTPASSAIPRLKQPPFLSSVDLKTFREFPAKRQFELGTVNLFCGANGSGKTSVLEAIELIYCGRNKRNIKSGEPYTLVATFSDGTTESASNKRPPSVFRERNLMWYGQLDVLTANLYQSFSQFNFLNTDAAVGLAESPDDLEDDLSKLLVGPEASKVWREIERTSEKLAGKLKELDAIHNQLDLELFNVNLQLSPPSDVKQESSAIFGRLLTMTKRHSWGVNEQDRAAAATKLVAALSELEPLLKQAVSFEWAGSPVSLKRLASFVTESAKRCTTAEDQLKRLTELRDQERREEQNIHLLRQSLADSTEIAEYYAADFPTRFKQLEQQEYILKTNRPLIVGYSDITASELAPNYQALSCKDFFNVIKADRTSAEDEHKAAQTKYKHFSALREESQQLSQQLRNIARQILLSSQNPDTCPLCHTTFKAGELEQHLERGLNIEIEAQASTLLSELRRCENRVESTHKAELTANWIRDFCKRSKRPLTSTVESALSAAAATYQESETAEQLIRSQRAELQQWAAKGLSTERYQFLSGRMTSQIESIPDSGKTNSNLGSELTIKIATASSTLESLKEESTEVRQATEKILDAAVKDDEAFTTTISRLRERVATGQTLMAGLSKALRDMPWPDDAPLTELVVIVKSIRDVVSDFQTTSANELQTTSLLAAATARKDQIGKQLAGLTPRIDRLREAQNVLTNILTEHSLQGAMENALRQNRVAIEAIFNRIHSPAEFSGLGETMTTLVRKKGGTANLKQISTGQRAAFALSLFLAQNSHITMAPPVILIDDPIAHVDDLNCLSFLDYLREVIVAGGRQVIFATASEKLAILFQRKFDFLGPADFRRYDLER